MPRAVHKTRAAAAQSHLPVVHWIPALAEGHPRDGLPARLHPRRPTRPVGHTLGVDVTDPAVLEQELVAHRRRRGGRGRGV